MNQTYVVNVLALELRDQGVETVGVSLNANGLKDGLDISGRGRLVTAECKEKVSCEVLHFECGF